MKLWYQIVRDDITNLPDFLDYYQKEYEDAKKEVRLLGSGYIEKASASLPQVVEHRFAQLQDIESVLKTLNIQYEKLRSEVFKQWFENQRGSRALTARECERYVDMDSSVNDMAEYVNQVSLMRNLFLAIHKGLDQKSFQISTISRLRVAGLQDSEI